MRVRPEDTHPDAEKAQLKLLRKATVSRRVTLACSLSQCVIDLAKRAIRRRYPHAEEQEILIRFVSIHYGAELALSLSNHLNWRSQ